MAASMASSRVRRAKQKERFLRSIWLKTQITSVNDLVCKIPCVEVKSILESQYGSLNEHEVGHIMKSAFPGIARRRHCSGYKYHYYGVSRVHEISPSHPSSSQNKTLDVIEKEIAPSSNSEEIKSTDEVMVLKEELDISKQRVTELETKLESFVWNSAMSCMYDKVNFPCISSQFLSCNQLEEDHVIGKGVFGTCSLKHYRNISVAVKVLREGTHKDVLMEAKALRAVEGHPNLPILFGISPKLQKEKYIITKFHGKGLQALSFADCLHNIKKDNSHINLCQIPTICLGIAKGLQYIHIKHLLHNDLKCNNIVIDCIDGTACPVIIDFGKSCKQGSGKGKFIPLNDRKSYLDKYSHIAPETINGRGTQSVRSDIYSLGKVYISTYNHVGKQILPLYYLAKNCVQENQAVRPSLDTIVSELNALKLQ